MITNIRKGFAQVIFWLVLCGFFSPLSAVQLLTKGRLAGEVRDAKTGAPLYGANVMVKGTLLGASADATGVFSVEGIPAGLYDIEVSMMGYEKRDRQGVTILPGQETNIVFLLQPTVLQQPALIVTATKRKQAIEDAPTSVDVLGIREIQNRSIVGLDEALQNTAGLGVIKGQIDLRGSTGFNWSAGSRVLLMVDGHPLINGDTGGINWDVIPVEEVERIEVVKGAGSALYGSNAMAGMVNIITQDPTPFPETRFKLSYGLYDEPAYSEWKWTDRFALGNLLSLSGVNLKHALSFEEFHLSHSRQVGKIGLLCSATRKQSSEYYQNGHYSRWNVLLKTKIPLAPNKNVTVTGNWALNKRGDFIQWVSKDRPLELAEEALSNWVYSEKASLHFTFQHGVNQKFAYTLKSNWYYYYWHNHFHDNQDYAKNDRIGAEAQVDYLLGRQSLTFGTEITTNQTRSVFYNGDHTMWDFALYAEDEFKFSPLWTLTLGTRYDYHQNVGISHDQQISPRMGLVFRPWVGSAARFSAGHGFRAPSIAEVFANTTVSGFRIVPNFELKEAERAWSFEIGMRQVLAFDSKQNGSTTSFLNNPIKWAIENFNPNWILDVALFTSHYKNMIDVALRPKVTVAEVQFVNMGRARIRGVETRIEGSLFNGYPLVRLGYTVLDPLNLDTRRALNYRSRHRLNMGLEITFWRITVGWDYRYASRTDEIVNLLGSGYEERVPMHVMDGRVIFDLSTVQISIEAKNFLNYQYTLRQRFIEPIRHFVITVKGKL
ncbi:TonB-dependent receptor [bacterium]|nr:TonB-dependent receptor [bacterium]RQV93282.1 MAG: TonB-dependent receptor [bacterium]